MTPTEQIQKEAEERYCTPHGKPNPEQFAFLAGAKFTQEMYEGRVKELEERIKGLEQEVRGYESDTRNDPWDDLGKYGNTGI